MLYAEARKASQGARGILGQGIRPRFGGKLPPARARESGRSLKLLICILILLGGLTCSWLYLRKPVMKPLPESLPEDSPLRMIRADRPWRRVGAAICLILSIMFVLGVYLVDIPEHPRTYAAFWLVMMLLVVWLCVLAIKDVLYTRQIIAKWRAAQRMLMDPRRAGVGEGAPPGPEATPQDSKP